MSSNEPVFTLPAWAATITGASWSPRREHVLQRVGAHPALLVGRHALQRLRAKAQHLQRDRGRDVRLATNDDAHRRRALQPLLLDVPAALQQHRTARRGQPNEVGHLAARREADARLARQIEQLHQPRRSHLLGDGAGRLSAYRTASWSQAVASQSAASAAGSDPPITNPK